MGQRSASDLCTTLLGCRNRTSEACVEIRLLELETDSTPFPKHLLIIGLLCPTSLKTPFGPSALRWDSGCHHLRLHLACKFVHARLRLYAEFQHSVFVAVPAAGTSSQVCAKSVHLVSPGSTLAVKYDSRRAFWFYLRNERSLLLKALSTHVNSCRALAFTSRKTAKCRKQWMIHHLCSPARGIETTFKFNQEETSHPKASHDPSRSIARAQPETCLDDFNPAKVRVQRSTGGAPPLIRTQCKISSKRSPFEMEATFNKGASFPASPGP